MIISLYRPSPQIPRPSAAAALRCYESAAYVTNLGSQQVKKAAIDITWIFLLTIYMSLNIILWSVSYPDVRRKHPREEIEELINTSLDIVDQCSERWPGASAASQLYSIFAKACLQSYDASEEMEEPPMFATTQYDGPNSLYQTPPSQIDPNSPSTLSVSPMPTAGPPNAADQARIQDHQKQQVPIFSTPQFGYVFDNEEPTTQHPPFGFDEGPDPNQPQFRSGSIFLNPASTEPIGRRFSYFPPDAPPPAPVNGDMSSLHHDDTTPTSTVPPHPNGMLTLSPSFITSPDTYISPPGANNTYSTMSPAMTITTASSPTPTPTMRHVSPMPMGLGLGGGQTTMSLPPPMKFESPAATPQSQHAQPANQRQQQQQQQQQPPMVAPGVQSGLRQGRPPPFSMQQQPGQAPPRQPMQPPQQRPLPPPRQPLSQASSVASASPASTAPSVTTPVSASAPPMGDWFAPQPPFLSPYAFSAISGGGSTSAYLSDPTAAFSGYGLGGFGGVNHPLSPLQGLFGSSAVGVMGTAGPPGGAGANHFGGDDGSAGAGTGGPSGTNSISMGGAGAGGSGGDVFAFGAGGPLNPQRQGSLSQEQQMELLDVLETEGMEDIDAFLSLGIGMGDAGGNGDGRGGPPGGINWA